jgi:hypothetical protein
MGEIKILADGGWAVSVGYDPKLLPVLRALPGAKWDGALKVRRISNDPVNLPQILEVANVHGWTVDPKILELAAGVAVEQDEASSETDRLADDDPRLFPFQREGIKWLGRQDRALLGDEMGTGKSVQSLKAVPPGAPLLIVCNASMKLTWLNQELAKWRPDFDGRVLNGRGSFEWPKPGEAVIVNYDILPAFDADVEDPAPGTVMIIDEVHNCKGAKTRRTKAVTRLARLVERVFGLTGTPLLNRAPELWQLLNTLGLADRAFGHFGRFYFLFGGYKTRFGTEWGTPKPEVAELLKKVMLRRSRETVLPDLPGKRFKSVIVNNLKAGLRKRMDEVAAALDAGNLWDKLDGGSKWEDGQDVEDIIPGDEDMVICDTRYGDAWEEGGDLSNLRQMTKAEREKSLLPSFEAQETPLVVFSAHRAPIDLLAKRNGWRVITGDETDASKDEAKRLFQAGELKGIALTIGAGREGITLTHGAHMVFVDLSWVSKFNQQSQDRICRIGQKAEGLLYTTLVADHPLDRRLEEILQVKDKLSEIAVTRAEVDSKKTMTETVAILADRKPAPKVDAPEVPERVCPSCKTSRPERIAGEKAKNPGKKFFMCRPCNWFEWTEEVAASKEDRVKATLGLQSLAEVCNGARSEDMAGFNKMDTARGKQLAELSEGRDLFNSEIRWALKILPKYHRQLPEGMFPPKKGGK